MHKIYKLTSTEGVKRVDEGHLFVSSFQPMPGNKSRKKYRRHQETIIKE